MSNVRPSEAGFTLVELLVALAIFALISVAGVTLLRSGSDTQIAVKARLEQQARFKRLANALEADLAQTVPRPVRDTSGQPVPAWSQDQSGEPNILFGFVRAGWTNLDEAPRANLQRVAYMLRDGKLQRLNWPMLDGASPDEAGVLVENVTGVSLRFRDDKGEWRDDWTATDPSALPRAMELRLTAEGVAEQRMLFLVGPQTRLQPALPRGDQG
ncbi:MAG: type II secretion system minor pseudopilin GspJ [Sphingomonadaceae bacterium]|nr:type II secretion system minor pseudopilin GspJ [Sphingomonadaceae bacterium]